MMDTPVRRQWTLIPLTLAAFLCGTCGRDESPLSALSPSSPAPLPQTFLNFRSEPGEYVGNGQTVQLTPDTVSITAVVGCGDNQIEVRVRGTGQTWDLHLAAPRGGRLYAGTFNDARQWPVAQPAEPAIAFYGNGRGCGAPGGHFVVTEAIFAPDGGVERFHATFEQKCLNFIEPARWPTLPALRGEVRLTAVPQHAQPFLFCR